MWRVGMVCMVVLKFLWLVTMCMFFFQFFPDAHGASYGGVWGLKLVWDQERAVNGAFGW